MGQRRRKKNYYEKLSEKLKRIINLEIAQYIKSGAIPNFSKIYKHLANNKNRPRFGEVLEDFENYLLSFIIDRDSSAKEFDISLTNLSGTPVEVEYKRLLNELEKIRNELKKSSSLKEKVLSADDSHQQQFQYWVDRAKGFSEYVAESTWNFAKSINSTAISALKDPLSSAKSMAVLTMYTLASNPVAGYRLIQKRSSSYLKQIETLAKSEWYRLYDAFDEMMDEFDRELELNQLDKKTQRNFFEFLKYALDGGVKNRLLEQDKQRLFNLTQRLLNQSYNISDSDDLKLLYDLFNVYLRLDFTERYADPILADVSRYAKRIADSRENINDKDKRAFTEFFWILQANFDWYGGKINAEGFSDLFSKLQSLNCNIDRWDNSSIFSFRIALAVMRRLRSRYKNNASICRELDHSSSALVDYILRLAKSKHYLIAEEAIKESFYIEYVRNLPAGEEKSTLFAGKYKVVSKKQVFPNSFVYAISGTRIKIFLQQPLIGEEKSILEETIENTYARVEKLKQAVNSQESSVSLEDTTFNLYIYNDNDAYVKYGPLWRINTAGGGYTHVRFPEVDERPFDYEQHKNEKWYEAFVYKQPQGDRRDGENKEGRGFRNLGHEVQHKFFYAWIGHAELHHLPSWLVEGAANALGNEPCFKEEADYIKRHEDKLPSMQKINAMTYASGADHYYFGSALFRFMLEQDPNFLGKIINSAKAGEKADTITTLIKQWIAGEDREAHFSRWLKGIIHTCSLVKDTSDKNTSSNLPSRRIKPFSIPKAVTANPGRDRGREIVERTTLSDLARALQNNASDVRELMEKIDFTQENIYAPLNANGDRIIHYAVRAKNWGVLWKLFLEGASLETCNNKRITAYAMARSSYSQQNLEKLERWQHDAKAARLPNPSDGTVLVPPTVTSTTVPGVVAVGTTVINLLTTSTTSTYSPDEEDPATSFAWWKIASMTAVGLGVVGVAFWAGYRCNKSQNNKLRAFPGQELDTLVTTPPDSAYGGSIAESSNASQTAAYKVVPVNRGLVYREETLPSGTIETTYLINLTEERNYLIDILGKRLAFLKPLDCYWRFEDDIKQLRPLIGLEAEKSLSVLANIQFRLENKEIEKEIKKCEKGYSEIESAKVIIDSLAQRFRLLNLTSRQPVISYLENPLKNGLLIMIHRVQGQSELLRKELENLSGERKDLISILYKRLIDLETSLYDAMFFAHSPVYDEADSADAKPIASYYETYQFSAIRNALIPSTDKQTNKELEAELDSRSNKECLKKHLRSDLPPKLRIILNVLDNLVSKVDEIKNKVVRKTLTNNIQSMQVSISELKSKLEADIQYKNGIEEGFNRALALKSEEQPLLDRTLAQGAHVMPRHSSASSCSSASSGFFSEEFSRRPKPPVLPKSRVEKVAVPASLNRGFYQPGKVDTHNALSQGSEVYYNFASSSHTQS